MSDHCWPVEKCRICGNSNLVSLINLGNQNLTGIFPKEKWVSHTCGPLELVKCVPVGGESTCGLVQLKHCYNLNELYGKTYGYHSGLNQSMVDHLHEIVKKINRTVPIRAGDAVIDIGSNDGTLLNAYSSAGIELYGIDPSAEKFREFYPEHSVLITEFFPSVKLNVLLKGRKAKVITTIAMFYDLEDPLSFARSIYDNLDNDGIWVSEQSYLPSMLKTVSYDTICHEHLEYYSLRQIKLLAQKTGFHIIDMEINDVNGGSFCFTLAKRKSDVFRENTGLVRKFTEIEKEEKVEDTDTWKKFCEVVKNHRERLLTLLHDLKKSGKKVLGYGASTKGNVILQYCGITPGLLPHIAEVNAEKFGCYTPGTHIPIISEKEAKQMKPDYFLVLPWHFKENIIQREKDYIRNGGKLIFPMPKIEIVG